MGIGAITSMNNMSAMQLTSADLKDQKSKSIQTEITDVQQQMRKLSSDEELSVTEKANEQKKLQKEKSSLDTELKQHQEELLRSHKREIRMEELLEGQNPAKEEETEKTTAQTQTEVSADETDKENLSADGKQPLQPGTIITQNSDGTVILKEVLGQPEKEERAVQNNPAAESREEADTAETEDEDTDTNTDPISEFRPSAKEMQAMVSADSTMEIAGRQGTLVAKTNDGIAVLKGEMKLDEMRGTDTQRKQADLEEMQKQSNREVSFQFSLFGDADKAMQQSAETGGAAKILPGDAEKNFQVSGLHVPQDEQAAQAGFHVSIA